MKRIQNIPYISEKLLQNMYAGIYQNEDISLFDRITNNPSSGGNPSSGSMSSRFFQNTYVVGNSPTALFNKKGEIKCKKKDM